MRGLSADSWASCLTIYILELQYHDKTQTSKTQRLTIKQAAVKAERKDSTVKEENNLLHWTGITKVPCPKTKTAAIKIHRFTFSRSLLAWYVRLLKKMRLLKTDISSKVYIRAAPDGKMFLDIKKQCLTCSISRYTTAILSMYTETMYCNKTLQQVIYLKQPVPVAQWVKPLLTGHSACWPDWLRALKDPGSNPGLKWGCSAWLD